MRKFLLTLLVIPFLLLGCSEVDFMQKKGIQTKPFISQAISKEDALDIANIVLKKSPNTRISCEQATFEYVTNEQKTFTRYSTSPDTLAYVINYPNDEGFVIVSSDRRVYPVLAFSDNGHFSFSNDIAKSNFIDRIGSYIDNADPNAYYNVQDTDFKGEGCYAVEPIVKTSLGQQSPWDKYVIQEHPGCYVGCVALATALVLSHSQTELTYHGTKFYFKSIIEAINKKQAVEETNITDLYDDWYQIDQPTYTYEQAVDSMAKFLYYIGLDVNMDYGTSGSYAFSLDAYKLCNNLIGKTDSEYSDFNINDVSWLLKNNYIIYLRSINHAWVSDGCYFCVASKGENGDGINIGGGNEEIISTYIHCDWGWYGSSNGYYSADVLENGDKTKKPLNYFAIKREHKKNNFFFKKC